MTELTLTKKRILRKSDFWSFYRFFRNYLHLGLSVSSLLTFCQQFIIFWRFLGSYFCVHLTNSSSSTLVWSKKRVRGHTQRTFRHGGVWNAIFKWKKPYKCLKNLIKKRSRITGESGPKIKIFPGSSFIKCPQKW